MLGLQHEYESLDTRNSVEKFSRDILWRGQLHSTLS